MILRNSLLVLLLTSVALLAWCAFSDAFMSFVLFSAIDSGGVIIGIVTAWVYDTARYALVVPMAALIFIAWRVRPRRSALVLLVAVLSMAALGCASSEDRRWTGSNYIWPKARVAWAVPPENAIAAQDLVTKAMGYGVPSPSCEERESARSQLVTLLSGYGVGRRVMREILADVDREWAAQPKVTARAEA